MLLSGVVTFQGRPGQVPMATVQMPVQQAQFDAGARFETGRPAHIPVGSFLLVDERHVTPCSDDSCM